MAQLRNAAPQMGFEPAAVAGRALAATTLALALNGATPSLTQAAVEPPAVVRNPPLEAVKKRLPMLRSC